MLGEIQDYQGYQGPGVGMIPSPCPEAGTPSRKGPGDDGIDALGRNGKLIPGGWRKLPWNRNSYVGRKHFRYGNVGR